MEFTEKTPEYKACIQFMQAISPNHKPSTTNNVKDLTSPTEAETMQNDDILFVKTKDIEMNEQNKQTNSQIMKKSTEQ